jgi:hypothetical protein
VDVNADATAPIHPVKQNAPLHVGTGGRFGL